MAFAICRIKKLKNKADIGGLNSHLTRSMEVPNADKELSWLNHRKAGTNDLNMDVSKRLQATGITPRKNAVLAVEHLLTASPEYFKLSKKEREDKRPTIAGDIKSLEGFLMLSVDWLNKRYGKENVVNVTIHLDEKTPHIHAIVVPIDSKGKLNARGLFGGRDKMRGLQQSYADAMKPLGLLRGVEGSKATHTTVKEFYNALNNVKNDDFKAVNQFLEIKQGKVLNQLKNDLNVFYELNRQFSNQTKLTMDLKNKKIRKMTPEEIQKMELEIKEKLKGKSKGISM